jgi:hypothetical protein
LNVEDIVILQDMPANFKVVPFNALLSDFNGLADDPANNRLLFRPVFEPRVLTQPFIAVKSPQFVLKGDIEPRTSWVSLSTAATAQLVVNAPCFVSLRAQNMQATQSLDSVVFLVVHELNIAVGVITKFLRGIFGIGFASQDDVNAATCHVGCDRDFAQPTRFGDNLSLPLVVLRVQNIVRDAIFQGFFQPSECLVHVLFGNFDEFGEAFQIRRVKRIWVKP